jgi:hypothetical protein
VVKPYDPAQLLANITRALAALPARRG